MKFKGQHVALSSTPDGINIRMNDGTNSVSLFLTEMEGAQLMSYLMMTYGITEIEIEGEEEVEEQPVRQKVVH
jgi:hypothetical protein